MKKFETSEDLDQLTVELPLNKARAILTMCATYVHRVVTVLAAAKEQQIEVGSLQESVLKQSVQDFKHLQDLVGKCLDDYVTVEEQDAIAEYEKNGALTLQKEFSETDVTNRKRGLKVGTRIEEFEDVDIPAGTVVVPGSKEEN